MTRIVAAYLDARHAGKFLFVATLDTQDLAASATALNKVRGYVKEKKEAAVAFLAWANNKGERVDFSERQKKFFSTLAEVAPSDVAKCRDVYSGSPKPRGCTDCGLCYYFRDRAKDTTTATPENWPSNLSIIVNKAPSFAIANGRAEKELDRFIKEQLPKSPPPALTAAEVLIPQIEFFSMHFMNFKLEESDAKRLEYLNEQIETWEEKRLALSDKLKSLKEAGKKPHEYAIAWIDCLKFTTDTMNEVVEEFVVNKLGAGWIQEIRGIGHPVLNAVAMSAASILTSPSKADPSCSEWYDNIARSLAAIEAMIPEDVNASRAGQAQAAAALILSCLSNYDQAQELLPDVVAGILASDPAYAEASTVLEALECLESEFSFVIFCYQTIAALHDHRHEFLPNALFYLHAVLGEFSLPLNIGRERLKLIGAPDIKLVDHNIVVCLRSHPLVSLQEMKDLEDFDRVLGHILGRWSW